jgi:hypothetical protein
MARETGEWLARPRGRSRIKSNVVLVSLRRRRIAWTRFALAVKHTSANLYAKKHDPADLYGPEGLFRG